MGLAVGEKPPLAGGHKYTGVRFGHVKGALMFCYKCGKEIQDNSMFCSFCGAKLPTGNTVESVPAPETVTLTIDRASQVYLINPPVKVVIDEKIRLSVENGRSEQVQLTPGAHHVELSASMRKTVVDLELQKDSVLTIGFNRLSGKIMAEIS